MYPEHAMHGHMNDLFTFWIVFLLSAYLKHTVTFYFFSTSLLVLLITSMLQFATLRYMFTFCFFLYSLRYSTSYNLWTVVVYVWATMFYDSASSDSYSALRWAVHWYSDRVRSYQQSPPPTPPLATSPQQRHPPETLGSRKCVLAYEVHRCSDCLSLSALTAGCRGQWSSKRAAE